MAKPPAKDPPAHPARRRAAGKAHGSGKPAARRVAAGEAAHSAASATTSAHSLTGQFLIAMPGMGDPNFERGITFICQHSEEGAMGLIVNRLSEYTLGDVLRQMHMPCERPAVATAPVLMGGPVAPERGFVLHGSSGRSWDSSYRVNDMVTITTSRDVLAAMADGEGPEQALVALGYAGWGAGQLEQELRENAWLTVAADAHVLFDTALDERWGAAVALVGINPANLTSYSGRA